MTTIVTRAGKGTPLSYAEMDANFTNLNTNKLETGFPATSVANTPAGNISATNVQAALNELDTEKASTGSLTGKADIASPIFTGTVTSPRNYNVSGTTGALQVAGVDAFRFGADNSGQLAGFRNVVINGNFGINQRVYISGAAVGVNLYGHDRWKMAASADTYTFATALNVTTVTIPAGKVLQQVVEGLNLLSGTYTLSWIGTAQGKIGAGAYGVSGITGVAVGGTDLTIEFGPGTVSRVQLELGSLPSTFENRPIGFEFEMCRRYYRESKDYGSSWAGGPGNDTGVWINGTDFYDYGGHTLRGAPMRALPTMVFYDIVSGTPGTVRNVSGAANVPVTSVNNGMSAYRISTTAGTATHAAGWHWSASAEL